MKRQIYIIVLGVAVLLAVSLVAAQFRGWMGVFGGIGVVVSLRLMFNQLYWSPTKYD